MSFLGSVPPVRERSPRTAWVRAGAGVGSRGWVGVGTGVSVGVERSWDGAGAAADVAVSV